MWHLFGAENWDDGYCVTYHFMRKCAGNVIQNEVYYEEYSYMKLDYELSHRWQQTTQQV